MLNEVQKRTAQAIVNIFETGSAGGDYANVTVVPGDPGHLTYGRSQTTLPTGNLYLLIKAYVEAPGATFAAELAQFLPALKVCDLALDDNMTLRSLLHRAGSDPVMRAVQDDFFERIYWTPAVSAANRLGIETALGTAVVYDSTVHGSFRLMCDRTDAAGRLGTAGIAERDWISRYVAVRRNWLSTHSIPLLRRTVVRMDEMKKLIEAGNWELDLPIVCRGVRIDAAVVGGGGDRISAHVVEERLMLLRTPMMQGADVLDLQRALIRAGARNLSADGIFGPDTERAVRDFQQRFGLTIDGIAGPATRSALEGSAAEVIPLAAE